MDLSQYLDVRYIISVIFISRYVFNYSFIKNISWITNHKTHAIAIFSLLLTVPFLIYHKFYVPNGNLFYYAISLAISYTITTSIYELLVKKLFDAAEQILGVMPSAPPPPPSLPPQM